MATDVTIPLFPCRTLETMLAFYEALGFEVTHRQTDPYIYGAVHRNGVDLHFFKPKGRRAAGATATALVMVDEVEALHAGFVEGLRTHLGAVPLAGTPCIMRMRPSQTRFALTDPAGNTLIFICRREPEMDYEWEDDAAVHSRLARALATAVNLRDFQYDDASAARVLDVALRRDEPGPPLDRARVLAARAELAVALGEPERLAEVRAALAGVPLSPAEREAYRDELEAADTLERLLASPPRS